MDKPEDNLDEIFNEKPPVTQEEYIKALTVIKAYTTDERVYKENMEKIDVLMKKGEENLTKEDESILQLLVVAAEMYEDKDGVFGKDILF